MNWQRRALVLRRLPYRNRVRGTPLQLCWDTPVVFNKSDWRRCSFLACDAEMSSLDPTSGELLSLGWVLLEKGAIRLDTAEHFLLQSGGTVGQSATIHHLRDCEFGDAQAPQEVARRFLLAAAGRTLVFHNARLDMAFLNSVCREFYGAPLLLPHVDTLQSESRAMHRRNLPVKQGELRLQACRDRYNLPQYPPHNALLDALATAELLLAQLQSGATH